MRICLQKTCCRKDRQWPAGSLRQTCLVHGEDSTAPEPGQHLCEQKTRSLSEADRDPAGGTSGPGRDCADLTQSLVNSLFWLKARE